MGPLMATLTVLYHLQQMGHVLNEVQEVAEWVTAVKEVIHEEILWVNAVPDPSVPEDQEWSVHWWRVLWLLSLVVLFYLSLILACIHNHVHFLLIESVIQEKSSEWMEDNLNWNNNLAKFYSHKYHTLTKINALQLHPLRASYSMANNTTTSQTMLSWLCKEFRLWNKQVQKLEVHHTVVGVVKLLQCHR